MSSDITDTTWFYELLAWAETHKKQIIAAVLGVAVLALIISYAIWRKDQTALAANEALFKLNASTMAGEKETSPSADAYLRLAADYPSTLAGGRALLLGAGAYYNDGKYTEALDQFRKFQKEYRHDDLDPIAAYGVATCLDALNRVDEAIQAYQEVIRLHGRESVADQARVALGRLYESKNQPEQALKFYDELMKDGGRTAWSSAAVEQRDRLLARYPNLAPKPLAVSSMATNSAVGSSNVLAVPAEAGKTNQSLANATNTPSR